ncbi:STAS domain-containing protein [Dactylosporangium sp. NPDC048998]|uniref:STAS domain-containing protein n=1 Tax=Dactylosporangium sp. NPDC048998 TaxID=3363976 RepID=UPI003710221F
MKISTSDAGEEVTLIVVSGEIDLQTADQLRDAVHAALALPIPRIVIDLAGIEFCDSTGLSVFVYGHRSCMERNGFLALAAPNAFMTRLLTTVGIAERVPIFDTVATAIDAVAHEPDPESPSANHSTG